MERNKPATVKEYIAAFPAPVRKKLNELRSIIRQALPDAEEKISYAIPAYRTESGFIIYFSGYKNHIGMYPAPTGSASYNKKILPYRQGKSTMRFALDEEFPVSLIEQTIRLRLKLMNETKKIKSQLQNNHT